MMSATTGSHVLAALFSQPLTQSIGGDSYLDALFVLSASNDPIPFPLPHLSLSFYFLLS